MLYIEIDEEIKDSFQVLDKHDVPVTGLTQGNFTIKLYNPSKNDVANISGGVEVDIEEVGDGFYRTSFTPDTLGAWNLIIIHSTHFPEGMGEDYYCVESLGGGVTTEIEEMIRRILGLSQHNLKITDEKYDKLDNLIESTISIYPSATDLENETNLLYQYKMTSTWNKSRHLREYQFKEIK